MKFSQRKPGVSLPGGKWVMAWGAVLGVSILAFVWNLITIFIDARADADYQKIVSNLRVVSQRVDASARDAVTGRTEAFGVLTKARQDFGTELGVLANGREGLASPRELLGEELTSLGTVWSEVDGAIGMITDRQAGVRLIADSSAALAESIPKVQQRSAQVVDALSSAGAGARLVAMAERQSFLAERIGRNIDRMLAGGVGGNIKQLDEDAGRFASALAELGGAPGVGPDARAALGEITELMQPVLANRQRIADAAPEIEEARTAAGAISANAPRLSVALSTVSEQINTFSGERALNTTTALALGLLIVIALVMIGVQSSMNARRRLELTAQTNERNQQAILRLLDELAGLADGDLTTTATVTEDFTGAIADAINFTIDQLRAIVSSINATSRNVSNAAEDTQATALHLAEAAEHQAQEIVGASSAINEMAVSIDQVSSNAAESASVADRSVALAKTGSQVVQNTIGGMDTIREQIQETSKRIKRLGESSQEIGDIVSLINDISDQTNILALNAAIQASMAGDAGRGFAVVADEVQRLAERSGAATKQIEALVKTIQSDTQEAVLSMEQTTAEVVRGARLAEDAGVALEEIESVSKNLAALIQNISNAARQQASSAGHVSNTMNIIQEITSQTSAGTTATAQSIGKLAGITNELRNSVAGFKLPDEGRSSGRAR